MSQIFVRYTVIPIELLFAEILKDHLSREDERSNESKRVVDCADKGQQSSPSSRPIPNVDVEAESIRTHLPLYSKSSFNDGMVEI